MSFTSYTLALDPETWDLQIGADGALKTINGDDAILQNVANACRCFTNDLYFDCDRGIPWYEDQLGTKLRTSVVRARLRETAAAVDGVESVNSVSLNYLGKDDRVLHGTIEITTENGLDGSVSF